MRFALVLLLVSVLGGGALYAQTDGFTVVTTESARRISIAHRPRPVPDATLSLATGVPQGLLADLRDDGRVVIVNFIYTRCTSICLAMGSELQQLQGMIRRRGLADRIRLLSVSFDPADTPEALGRYAQRMHADPRIWQFVGVPSDPQRRALLDAFGITTVPAPYGQIEHNAAYHVVTPSGYLARVVDYSEPHSALDFAMSQNLHAASGVRLAASGKPR